METLGALILLSKPGTVRSQPVLDDSSAISTETDEIKSLDSLSSSSNSHNK